MKCCRSLLSRSMKARSLPSLLFGGISILMGCLALESTFPGRVLVWGLVAPAVATGLLVFAWSSGRNAAIFVVASTIMLMGLLRVSNAGSDLIGLVSVFALLWGLWYLRRKARRAMPPARNSDENSSDDSTAGAGKGRDDEPLVSLVALLNESVYIDANIIATLASRAWNTTVGADDDNDDETSFVVGSSPHFLVRLEDWLFAVHNVPEPYFKNPQEVADSAPNARVRDAVESHGAWLSIDWIGRAAGTGRPASGAETRHEAYRLIGNLLAEFLDCNCLALCCPDAGVITDYYDSLEEALRGSDPLLVLRAADCPTVWNSIRNDPRMLAAVSEARRRWPEFVTAFENRDSDQLFSVKAPIGDDLQSELLWIHVTAIEHGVIYGTLGTQPLILEHWNLNDRVRVRLEDLRDWMFTSSDQICGGFTLEPLKHWRREQDAGEAW
jgi:uncharacterized protein YegJ (DUF2314 family)